MHWNRWVKVATAGLSGLCAGAASGEAPPLSSYGDLPGIEQVSISPSGKGIAIVGRVDDKRQLIVLNADRTPRATVETDQTKVRDLRFVGEDTVLLKTSVTETLGPAFVADRAEIFGALVIPLDKEKPWMVFGRSQDMANMIAGDFGSRLIDGKWLGYFSGIKFSRSSAGYDLYGSTVALYAVDFMNGSTSRLAQVTAPALNRDWLIDANGHVAATISISRVTGAWSIDNASGKTLASGVDLTGDISLLCLGQDGSSLIYGAEDDKEGIVHWYEVPLAGGSPKEVFADVAADDIFVDPDSGRLIGYVERGSPPRPRFFDPRHQAVADKVIRAFSKLHVEIKEWTPDFSHVLVRTSGNGDGGSWYIIDMRAMRADPVGNERPLILPEWVGPISTVEYKASDGMALDGILTLPPGRDPKNLPVILFPHGGPTAHDEAQFDWWAQAFASRGYAVFQPNFRGSTNRDDAFRRAGYGQWGRKMQTDVSDGLAELARRGIVDPKRACIMGASYGGYAALAGVTLQHDIYRCAVAVAGVSDLRDFYSTRTRQSGSNMTWRSLRESLGSPSNFDEVSPRKHADQANAPILLIHGKEDVVVPFKHSDSMAGSLKAANKPHELVVLRDEDHWLSRPETRKQMLEAAMGFVVRHNPPD